jgi:hypothetical protein
MRIEWSSSLEPRPESVSASQKRFAEDGHTTAMLDVQEEQLGNGSEKSPLRWDGIPRTGRERARVVAGNMPQRVAADSLAYVQSRPNRFDNLV